MDLVGFQASGTIHAQHPQLAHRGSSSSGLLPHCMFGARCLPPPCRHLAAGTQTEAFVDFVVGHGELWSAQLMTLACKQMVRSALQQLPTRFARDPQLLIGMARSMIEPRPILLAFQPPSPAPLRLLNVNSSNFQVTHRAPLSRHPVHPKPLPTPPHFPNP